MHDSSAFFGDLNYPLWYTKIGQLLENEELPAWLDIKSHISEDEYHIAAELLIGAVGLIASELQSPTDPKGYGTKSIDLLIYLILDCLKFNIDSLPSLDWFSSSKFTDNQGWGTSASSKEIGILLSSMSNLDSR